MGSDIHTFDIKPKHNPNDKTVEDSYASKLIYQKSWCAPPHRAINIIVESWSSKHKLKQTNILNDYFETSYTSISY
jgi:hypothetical protein